LAHRKSRYLPAEDTRLLIDALKDLRGDSCLEVGFGSAAVLRDVAGRFGLAVGTDVIDIQGAKSAKSAKTDLVLADKAACFRDGVFDLVFFNPPYLPSVGIEDITVDGGRGGIEVAISFLRDGSRTMKKDGTMVALMSDEGDLRAFMAECERGGLTVEEVDRKKLFYESLVVFEIRRKPAKGLCC